MKNIYLTIQNYNRNLSTIIHQLEKLVWDYCDEKISFEIAQHRASQLLDTADIFMRCRDAICIDFEISTVLCEKYTSQKFVYPYDFADFRIYFRLIFRNHD